MSAVTDGKAVTTDPIQDSSSGQSQKSPEKRRDNAATGASAASVRALTARLAAFYFRVPVKAFFRTRVDYMAFPRAINPLLQNAAATSRWSWRTTTPGILAHAVKMYGWRFIPNQVLPPMLANVTIGAVLYTSYLQTLGVYYQPASQSAKRVYPPAPFEATFKAGFSAGVIQSVVAAPMDALTIRFRTADLLEQRYKNMWHYAYHKVQALGTRGVFAGWGITTIKDSLGCGLFFATFEYVKSQCFYKYVSMYYGQFKTLSIFQKQEIHMQVQQDDSRPPVISPHYLMEPAFLLMAGATASIMQQVILHPLTQVQELHFRRLAGLDLQLAAKPARLQTFRFYAQAYSKTLKQSRVSARRAGGWIRWLYADFWMSTLRQVPSTSAGLIVFEILRRKYGYGADAVRISKDGYDILLP